jgi:hypothetical protein
MNNMKTWNFKVKSNPQEIIKKLETSLGSLNGFVFNVENKNIDLVKIKVRKRVLYGFQTVLRNHIIVNGKITKLNTENEANVEISFNQHFLNISEVSILLVLSLLAIIFGVKGGNATIYILGGIFLAVGITMLIWVKKEFARNVQEYKTLFSEILEL